jgi:N-acetylglucosaminyldiphosphoundecaprenol N-acetyl-beta-D-mannosaminyltransferase
METYFNIRYEFDVNLIHQTIDKLLAFSNESHFIPVADGVVLSHVNNNPEYKRVISESLFAICDSSYVPVYIKWIYGIKHAQYCGSDIFRDIVAMKKYRMFFMGTSQETLQGLKNRLVQIDKRIERMTFYELPYCHVDDFDYAAIAEHIQKDGADIIWIALGAPKQEIFMSKLKPYLKRGVMIAVGAVFKFYSGQKIKRAPEWMVKIHLEFVYRMFCEPKKQIKRCWGIVYILPKLFWTELKKKRLNINSKSPR